jgi:tRNA 2-thiouridine synthesizing protein A
MATHEKIRNQRAASMRQPQASAIARRWHAGGAGCGALIMGLKREIGLIEPGELLEVTALDAAAPIDIAAWCQMTGHALAAERHPTYVLKRKDD